MIINISEWFEFLMDEKTVVLYLVLYLGLQINSFILKNLISHQELLRNNQQILVKIIRGTTTWVGFYLSYLLLGFYIDQIGLMLRVWVNFSPFRIEIDWTWARIILVYFQDNLTNIWEGVVAFVDGRYLWNQIIFTEDLDVVDFMIERARLAADDLVRTAIRLANIRIVVTFFDVVFKLNNSIFTVLFNNFLDLFLFLVQYLFTDLIFVESKVILGEFFLH